MFGIVNDLLPLLLEEGQRLTNHCQVFVERGTDDVRDVKIPALAKDDNDRRIGKQQGLDVAVLLYLDVAPSRAAESRQFGVLQANGAGPREKL